MSGPTLRDDILVSVCFTDAHAPDAAVPRIAATADLLKKHYRYWEILVVNETDYDAALEEALVAVPNVRYLSVVRGLDNSQRRVIAASEAIGDFVVITSVNEVTSFDIPAMIDDAQDRNAVILGQRKATFLAEPFIALLGRASGFHASTRDMQTTAIPRTVLNRLLNDANPVLALRFPPRDNSLTVLRRRPDFKDSTKVHEPTWSGRMASRSDLMLRMVTEAGPSLLSAVALFSAFMFVSAVFFAVYVVIIYLTKTDIAEGWTTLSLSISGMLAFLGAALFAICVTLRKAMEIMRGRTIDYLVAERSSVDLFESVSNALNVDTDGTESLEDRRDVTPDSKLVHKQTAGGAP